MKLYNRSRSLKAQQIEDICNIIIKKNTNREELATMFYRYAEKLGYDVIVADDISVFPDADKVSNFAKKAMIWANGARIITGDSGMSNPQGTVNRAVGATMLSRFTDFIGKPGQNMLLYVLDMAL